MGSHIFTLGPTFGSFELIIPNLSIELGKVDHIGPFAIFIFLEQRIRDLFLGSPYLLFCAARVGVYSVVQDTVLEIRTEKVRARKRNGGGGWNRLQLL